MNKHQISCGVSASEMTYIVSGGALNSTHSLTQSGGRAYLDLPLILILLLPVAVSWSTYAHFCDSARYDVVGRPQVKCGLQTVDLATGIRGIFMRTMVANPKHNHSVTETQICHWRMCMV